MKYAKALQKTVLPVRLLDEVSPDSLPPDLSELQWVDYSRLDKDAFKSLQRTLKHLPKTPPLPDPLPDAPPVPISYLSNLRTKIDTDSQLELQDQVQLVFELRSQFRNGDPAKEIIDLLQRLKKREDLFAGVSRDIEDLQREIDHGQSGGEAPGSPSTAMAMTRIMNAARARVFKRGPIQSTSGNGGSDVAKTTGYLVMTALGAFVTWLIAGSMGALGPALTALLSILGGISFLAISLIYERYFEILGAGGGSPERESYVKLRADLASGGLAGSLYDSSLEKILDRQVLRRSRNGGAFALSPCVWP